MHHLEIDRYGLDFLGLFLLNEARKLVRKLDLEESVIKKTGTYRSSKSGGFVTVNGAYVKRQARGGCHNRLRAFFGSLGC